LLTTQAKKAAEAERAKESKEADKWKSGGECGSEAVASAWSGGRGAWREEKRGAAGRAQAVRL
jgi:hypothetical protein